VWADGRSEGNRCSGTLVKRARKEILVFKIPTYLMMLRLRGQYTNFTLFGGHVFYKHFYVSTPTFHDKRAANALW